MKTCPAAGCGISIRRGVFMCREHWFQVPAPLRRQINDTWRAFKQAEATAAKLGALRDYREATDEAVRLSGVSS